jgi:hypothetical protein
MAIGLAFLMASALHASEPRSNTPLPDADARTLYTLGQLISRTLESFALAPDELKYVGMGLEDGVLQREPKVDLAAEAPRLPGALRPPLPRRIAHSNTWRTSRPIPRASVTPTA